MKGFADVQNGQLYYEIAGEGHPLVLIHAGIADSRMWDDQWLEFSKHFRVVRFDIRGYGQSEMQANTSFAAHDDVRDLLNFLGIQQAYLLGISMGGSVALNFVLAYPQMVDALIVVATGLGGRSYKLPKEDQIDAAFGRGDIAAAVELELQTWVDGPERQPNQVDPQVRERVRALNFFNSSKAEPPNVRVIRLDPPAAERLGEISVPTLVIAGEYDVPEVNTTCDIVAAGIAGAKKVMMPGVAHMLPLEQPVGFNALVLDFLHALPKLS